MGIFEPQVEPAGPPFLRSGGESPQIPQEIIWYHPPEGRMKMSDNKSLEYEGTQLEVFWDGAN